MNTQVLYTKAMSWHQTLNILGKKALLAVAIIAIFWIIAIILKHIIVKLGKRSPNKQHVFGILGSVCKITLIIIGLITGLGSAGINVSAIVASLGLSGFAIGFALKDSLTSILSGFIIMLYQPYKIGDNITISSSTGKVEEINLRYTVLIDENKRMLIPNSSMLSTAITINV